MRLRRWRVARVLSQRKGGYDSPRTSYWTYRGARAAAIQLNMLHERFHQTRGFIATLSGSDGQNRWTPVRHRTLRGVQAHNIVMESGSYDRHPAGSAVVKAQAPRPLDENMTLAEWWLEGPGSELLRRFDRPGRAA